LKEKEFEQLKSQLSDMTINLSKSGASKLGSSKSIEEDKILEQSNLMEGIIRLLLGII
jgi:hypothetical protein